jgi:hypothetical protein
MVSLGLRRPVAGLQAVVVVEKIQGEEGVQAVALIYMDQLPPVLQVLGLASTAMRRQTTPAG